MKKNQLDPIIYTTYRDLDDSWDEGVDPSHFLYSSNVSLSERSKLEHLEYRYVLLCRGEKKIAQAYFQILSLQSNYISLQNPVWNYLSRISISGFKPRLLISGHLFRHDIETIFFHDSSISDYLQAKMMYQCCRELLKECRIGALLIKDPPARYDSYLLNHAEDCNAMKEDISMRLQIHPSWQTFEDYMDSLKHKYKQRAKKIRKRGQKLEIRNLDLDDIDREAPNIHGSYHQIIEKQMVKMGRINVDFLKNLKKIRSDFEIYGIYDQENTFLGFFSYFTSAGMLDMFYIGIISEENVKYNIYFNILYWALAIAIEEGCNCINYGRTALDPKASLGCEPYYSQNFYSLKSPIFSNITQRAQQRFMEKQGEVWEIRKPFNTSYYDGLQSTPSLDMKQAVPSTVANS